MNFTKKVLSVAAAAALIAGAGAVAATPASAKVKRVVTGGTVIEVPLALVSGAAGAGVTITPIKPALAEATSDVVGIAFPAQMPKTDGVLPHKGGLSFASAKTGVTLTFTNPSIEYATSGGDTAVISGTIGGIPDGNPLATLNGKPLELLDVKNFTVEWKIGKVKKVGKKFEKVLTQTMSGEVFVSSNGLVIDGVNALMGAPLFTAGMPFGALDTEWSVKVICDTAKECK